MCLRFLVLAIIGYLTYEQKALQLLVDNNYDEITNNTTYYFVALLPFCSYLMIID